MVKTKIVCTLGPASASETVLRKMMLEGMDVARLNFSHGSPSGHFGRMRIVRKLNKKYGRRVKVLQDLEGYRIRVGSPAAGQVELKPRQNVFIVNEGAKKKAPGVLPIDYDGRLSAIRPGHRVFIDDGRIALEVKSSSARRVCAKVIVGGTLKARKGVNLPDTELKFSGLTEKDRRDLEFGIKHKVDFIAQSFVRDKGDIELIRDIVKKRHPSCGLIAKIENRDGIKNIGRILDAADGIMIARGDMGISIPIYEVPIVQKEIIRECNRRRKLVITATQMLESMTENPVPTRAEVTDVANAVIDGTDMVMLSGETAVGKYPQKTVRMMNQILKFTESRRP
ncbi:MAG: pyruvate kinase [Endomicrobiales bacterium]|nr:pyruvate kinase [Endomicrobiales bacterium]